MKPTYEIVDSGFAGTYLTRTDPDGKVWSIPLDPDNSDYQAYLAEQENKE